MKNISIDKYRDILKSADLLPSRMILKDNIDDIFNIIKKQKIENVDGLQRALKNKNNTRLFMQHFY
ncbi:MAG: hypothetical protein KAV45_06410 [Calditrichia bacterium]|nr:hypothetical protein [Calditrichia bacterium]